MVCGGGGIWSGNEKHLLKMQGANIITDNFYPFLYFVSP